MLAARDADDDVLLAVYAVGHRRIAHAGRQLHLPHDFARRLVEGAEHLAAVTAAGRQLDIRERRMVAQTVTVRDRPADRALVEIDGDETRVRWLEGIGETSRTERPRHSVLDERQRRVGVLG